MSAIENLEIATILSNTKIDNKLIKKLEIDQCYYHTKIGDLSWRTTAKSLYWLRVFKPKDPGL